MFTMRVFSNGQAGVVTDTVALHAAVGSMLERQYTIYDHRGFTLSHHNDGFSVQVATENRGAAYRRNVD